MAAITSFNIAQFAYMVKKMHSLREGDGTLLDNCIMMWGSGLEDGNEHTRENLPFIIAGKGGGSIRTGRYLPDIEGNQGDLLTTLLACAGVPIDRPVGIATKQIEAIKARGGSRLSGAASAELASGARISRTRICKGLYPLGHPWQ